MPGDCLLYGPSSLFGYVICFKTWSWVCHVEVYIGEGKSVASRGSLNPFAEAVNVYPVRFSDLKYVLRPRKPFALDDAMLWFYNHAKGQRYDFLSLLCFTLFAKHGDMKKQQCSECATRLYRRGHFNPFYPGFDADKIAPANYLMSPAFDHVWHA